MNNTCCNPCCRVITYHCQGQAAEIYVEHNILSTFYLIVQIKEEHKVYVEHNILCTFGLIVQIKGGKQAQHNISCSRPLSTFLFEVRESTSLWLETIFNLQTLVF